MMSPCPGRTRRVTLEQARRIAVRAQLLDGSARGVLETVRRLGFLQLDPIATVAPPQHLVLWSRLGRYGPGELDRLLWVERKLFEWNAFIWPIESLPLIRARMRRHRRANTTAREGWTRDFLERNAGFRRYVLRELEHRGPLLGRELEDRTGGRARNHRWFGSRQVGMMLEVLHQRGALAVVGRRNGQRLWDLAGRWYPETETVPLRDAEKILAEYGYYVLPLLAGDRLVGRAEPRFDRKTGKLELLGAWGDTSRLDGVLAELELFLGAQRAERAESDVRLRRAR